ALRDQLDTAVLNGADIGDYQVLGQVIDSAGALLASDTAAFAVLADLNKQLLGTVVVQHAVLEAGQPQTCTHTVRNGGSIAAADLELHYAVVNIDTQQAVFDDSEVVTLPSDGENSADRTFSTRGLEGNYACVLQAKINTALATLAFAPFEVLPPPIEIDAEITTGNRGRLLVLLDSPKSADDKCRGVTQLDLSTDFAAALSPQATVTVSVQDKSGAVLDQENIDLASFSGPVNDNPGSDGVDLALTAFTDSGITMSLVPGADNDKAKLGTEYRFLAEVASDGTTITKESGPIHTSCSQPIAAGDQHGEFAISDLAVIAGTSAPKSDDPHGPKDAPDLVAQRAFLEELLTTAGWSATITDNAETFTGELRTGGYTVYALFNEQEKLSETVQKELREAVFRGEGLIVAGPHDSRNTKKQKLGHALGIKAHGHDSHAESVYIPAGVLTDAAGMIDLFAKDKVARIEPLTADSLATYEGTSAKGTATVDSVTVNDYGSGRGIFAGFDWLAAATRDSQGSLAAQALLKALAHAHPAATSPFAGSVAPLAMVLTNLGIATTAQATIDAPYNTRVIDAPQAEVTDTWIRWTFDLAEEQVLTLPFYLVLPETEGLVTIQGRVTAPVTDEGPGDLQAEPSLSIDVLPAQDGEDMNQAVDGLPAKLKKQVEKHLAKAFDYRDAKPEKALQEALKASDVLLDEGDQSEIALVRAKIAAWIRRLEMAIEQ
ncbi:MAG TPA: hypothetical protein DCO77_00270, partial [Nitrospiraceae bacterium]|nr:hypothetical protein [Nitrospiraceae bacterium]